MPSPYSYHFACFECRKSFSYSVLRSDKTSFERKCPDCGQALYPMGRKFKAPKRSDVKQWKKVELIHKAGMRHFPKYLWQAKHQVEAIPPKSEGERLLRRLRPKN